MFERTDAAGEVTPAVVDTAIQAGVAAGMATVAAEQATQAAAQSDAAVDIAANIGLAVGDEVMALRSDLDARFSALDARLSSIENVLSEPSKEDETSSEKGSDVPPESKAETVAEEVITPEADKDETIVVKHKARKYRRM